MLWGQLDIMLSVGLITTGNNMQDDQIQNLSQEMANDPKLFGICEIIGSGFGLHIDQVGALDSEIRGIFLGINKSSDFIDHIKTRLEIDNDTAQKIATEVNSKIFVALKEKMQSASPVQPKPDTIPNETKPPTETKPAHITDLEKAGGFTIEHSGDMTQNGEGIGSDVLRVAQIRDRWTPVQQTVVPTGTPIPTPKIETSVPQKTTTPPIQTAPTPAITETPKTITPNTDLPEQNIAGVSSTVLNPGSWPTKDSVNLPNIESTIAPNEQKQPIPDIATKPIEPELPKTKEPLADQLLSMLNKAKPIEPKKEEEIPVFHLDSYIKKTNPSTESKPIDSPNSIEPKPANPEIVTPKPIPATPRETIPPPIPVNPIKNNPNPIQQQPRNRGNDPYREQV